MNAKKSLVNRIRGWYPKEPNAPKSPTKTGFPMKMKTETRKQNSPSFKVRRWFHGVFAFTRSLLRQMSVMLFVSGVYALIMFSIAFLTWRNLISGLPVVLAEIFANFGFMLLLGAGSLYEYFRKKRVKAASLQQNKVNQSTKSNLKLGSDIMIVVGIAMMTTASGLFSYARYLVSNSGNFVVFPFYLGALPFYLGIFGIVMFLSGWGLFVKWRKRNKLNPSTEKS